jgi:glycosyltransferase involved in cell wall biosynthesis
MKINDFNSLHSSLDILISIINNNYKFAIVIPTYNRLDMIKKTLDSLFKTNLQNTLLFIIDDNSNKETKDFIKEYNCLIHTVKLFKKENKLMHDSFVMGFDNAIKNYPSIEYLITLDSDTIHKPNWLLKLHELYNTINNKNSIITGFNTLNHKITKSFKNYHMKHSIGGINMFFHKDFYIEHIRPILISVKKGWDWQVVFHCWNKEFRMYCTKPSVIQHIGNIGLHSKNGKYDKANDF